MEGSGRLHDFENPTGEAPGVDMRRPVARSLNKALKRLRQSPNNVMDLGGELGETFTGDIRGARADEEEGMLRLYIRQAGEHKKVVGVVVAAGVVIGGIAALKYKKR